VEAFASQWQAEVILLHAVPPPNLLALALSAKAGARAIRESRQRLLAFLPGGFVPLRVRRVVEQGEPAEAIVRYAERRQVDLIMMSSHGEGPFRRFLLGSVTSKVLHDSACPVWTDVHAKTPPRARPDQCRNILAAVDCDDEAILIVRYARELAEQYRAKLALVHVLPAADMHSRNRGEVGVRRYLLAKARKAFSRLGRNAGMRLVLQFKGGSIPGGIHEAALENRADLVVIGRGHAGKTAGRLRTHALAIIRALPCPVISV
jgi:nucleotide-binding universal stress UspA family protein